MRHFCISLSLLFIFFSIPVKASYVDEVIEALDQQMRSMKLDVQESPDSPLSKKQTAFEEQNQRHFKEAMESFQQRAEEELIQVVKALMGKIRDDSSFFEHRHQLVMEKNRERVVEWMKDDVLTLAHYLETNSDEESEVFSSDESDEDAWRVAFKRGYNYSSADDIEQLSDYDDYDVYADDPAEDSFDEGYEAWKQRTIFDYLGIWLNSSDDLKEEDVDDEAIRRFLHNHVQRGYSWLINEDIEGSLSTSEDFIDNHYQSMGLDKNILESVLCALWFDFDWEEHDFFDSKYIQRTYISTLMKLVRGQASFNLKRKLTKRISKLFVFHGEDFEEPFKKIPERFNMFVAQKNWLGAMIEWSVYTTYRKIFAVPHVSVAAHPFFHQMNRQRELRIKMAGAYDRAKKTYTKVYPHPATNRVVYGKKREGRAEINFAVELKKLKKIGQYYEGRRPSTAKNANIFVPQLYFVVSSSPTGRSDENNAQQFMPVSLIMKAGDKRAINRTNRDVVYKEGRSSDQFYYESAENHIVKGQLIQGKDAVKAQDFVGKVIERHEGNTFPKAGQAQRLIHSERVLAEALSDATYIQNMVVRFQEQLFGLYGAGCYTVYGGLMLGYSTNTVCEYCTPTLIALQNSTEQGGFLNLWVAALRQAQGPVRFNVFGYDDEREIMEWSKFRFNTIVTAKINFDCEAHDLADTGQHSHGHVSKAPHHTHNPKAKLFFKGDEINIKPSAKDGSPQLNSYFYEFVGPDLHTDTTIPENSIIPFDGAVFSSGSVNISA